MVQLILRALFDLFVSAAALDQSLFLAHRRRGSSLDGASVSVEDELIPQAQQLRHQPAPCERRPSLALQHEAKGRGLLLLAPFWPLQPAPVPEVDFVRDKHNLRGEIAPGRRVRGRRDEGRGLHEPGIAVDEGRQQRELRVLYEALDGFGALTRSDGGAALEVRKGVEPDETCVAFWDIVVLKASAHCPHNILRGQVGGGLERDREHRELCCCIPKPRRWVVTHHDGRSLASSCRDRKRAVLDCRARFEGLNMRIAI